MSTRDEVRAGGVATLAATASAAAAGLHLTALVEHLSARPATVAFFALASLAQAALAWLLLTRPARSVWVVAAGVNVVVLVTWIASRTVGVPGSGEGAETVARLDGVTAALEIAIVAMAGVALRSIVAVVPRRRRLPSGAMVAAVTLVAVAGGLAGLSDHGAHGDVHGARPGHAHDAGAGHAHDGP